MCLKRLLPIIKEKSKYAMSENQKNVLGTDLEVLSDECELVSVCLYIGWFMQHKAAAIRQVQRRV